MFAYKYTKILLVFTLLIIGFNTCFAQFSEEIIYDTVYVYDTVWEYETVYDTVWEYETVFDTVYFDENYDALALIEPITISNLNFTPQYYKAKTYQRKQTKQQKTKVKRSVFSKLRYELKNNKDLTRGWNWDDGSELNVTLNPTKGTFDPRILKRGIFSLDAYGGVGFQNTSYSTKNFDGILINNADSINELPALEYGLRLNYNLFQYGLQTGIGISQIRDEFKFTEHTFDIDSSKFNYIPRWEEYTDSVWVVNVDSALNGSNYGEWQKYTYDSLEYDAEIIYDTINRRSNKRSVLNTILYVEIPLILSYELAFSRLSMLMKFGGVNQVHIYAKGQMFNDAGYRVDINDHEKFTKYNFALYGGLGLKYKLAYDVSLILDAYYKHPLLKYSSSNSSVVRRNSFGINAGVRYCF